MLRLGRRYHLQSFNQQFHFVLFPLSVVLAELTIKMSDDALREHGAQVADGANAYGDEPYSQRYGQEGMPGDDTSRSECRRDERACEQCIPED